MTADRLRCHPVKLVLRVRACDDAAIVASHWQPLSGVPQLTIEIAADVPTECLAPEAVASFVTHVDIFDVVVLREVSLDIAKRVHRTFLVGCVRGTHGWFMPPN